MTSGTRTVDEELLSTARLRLLAASGTEHPHVFAAELAAAGDVLARSEEPCWRA